jgi:Caspase domain
MTPNNALFKHGYALLIGVGNYPYINPLPVTVNDATVLHSILTDPMRAAYPPDQVKLLVNEAASRQGILDGLQWILEKAAGDKDATVFIYFSGHGGVLGNQFNLIPYDYKRSLKEEGGIKKEEFINAIDAIHSKKLLVFLDCCHAAGMIEKDIFGDDFIADNTALLEALRKGDGRVVVASSSREQVSLILRDARYSAFTAALVEALDKEGDDGNGYAGVLATLNYIDQRVRVDTKSRQTPVVNIEGLKNFPICNINRQWAEKNPFSKSVAYLGGYAAGTSGSIADPVTDFQYLLLSKLEDGFSAVPDVLAQIRQSGMKYDKPLFANLRDESMSQLTALNSRPFITRLEIFIGTMRP